MRRRAIFICLAALVALALVPVGSASAANLTEERAFVLASKVGANVAKERNARYWRISRLVKKRTNRFVFEYFERLRTNNRFCKATVVVTQTGRSRQASLGDSRCGTIRGDVLASEQEVSDAIASLLPKVRDTRAAVQAYERGLKACETLNIPQRYRDDVDRFLELGVESTMQSKVTAELAAFADNLAAIPTEDRKLEAGATSWRKYLETIAAIPDIARDPCPALREWARDDYAAGSAPVDFDLVASLNRSLVRHGRRILDAGDRLYELGVSDRTLAAFTPYGLITTAAVEYDKQN